MVQAIADFLLSDPDDEGLWKGILLPPPPPSSRPAAPEVRRQVSPQLYYWKALLLDGALGACTPAIGERCLRLALRAVGGADDGGADDGGDDRAPWGRRGSSGAGERGGSKDDSSLVSCAVVVLRGLSRLARSVLFYFVFLVYVNSLFSALIVVRIFRCTPRMLPGESTWGGEGSVDDFTTTARPQEVCSPKILSYRGRCGSMVASDDNDNHATGRMPTPSCPPSPPPHSRPAGTLESPRGPQESATWGPRTA